MDHLKLEMDYRKVLDDPGIDGVMICTQDHWHARMVVEACYKGKDVYVQKPMALSVEESEAIVEAVRKMKRVFHIGTQQRCDRGCGAGFVKGVEYVRDGRLGKLARIDLGIIDNSPKSEWQVPSLERTPDPKDFDFDLWLGPASDAVRYSQLRTHWRPVDEKGKPYAKIPGQNVGWLQIKDYCTGNISGWGSHHVDIAQWAMENAGPISVKCEKVKFLQGRLFNVHDDCLITYKYANGVEMKLGTPRLTGYRCGVRFFGENGDWISTPFNHHRPWFLGMRSRQDTNVTVEEANVSTISCILGYHAMNEAGRTIGWDPEKRVFTNPDDQKRLYSCFERPQFAVAPIIREIRKKVGA